MHHTYHAPHVPPMTATALRERLTRKTQSELRASVTPVLIKALREATTSAERQRLARALGQLGPAARDAVPLLIERYQQAGSASERVTLLAVFGDIGPAARQALPFVLDVVENVRDESPAAYTSARRSLAHLAPAARCRHHDKDNRERARGDSLARDVLQRIDSPEDRSGIVDEGECFSLHALRQSQDQIRRLAKTYQIEVLIETVPDKTLESEDDHKVLAGNGVYLCIHKEDVPRVQVYLSEALCKQGVTDAELRQVVEPHLRKHDYDRGLQAAVAFLADFEAKQAGK